MGKIEFIEGSDIPHVEAGTYAAVLEDIEAATTRFGAAYKVLWRLPTEDDFIVSQIYSTSTAPGSNLGRMIKELTGRTLLPGERLPLDELRGKHVTLRLSVLESGYNKVEAVWPATPASVSAPTKPSPKTPLDDGTYQQFLAWKATQATQAETAAAESWAERKPANEAMVMDRSPAGKVA